MNTPVVGRDERSLFRWGAASAFVLALAYVVITGLYVATGAVPTGGSAEAWLTYLTGNVQAWWGIAGLSVLTDVLFVPVAAALYVALRPANRTVALIGSSLVLLFAVLDLAVTWPNYAVLVSLAAGAEAAGPGPTQFAAATYAATVLDSGLFGVYAILLPGVGILLLGLAMRDGSFGRMTAAIGILTGLAAIVAVVGPLLIEGLGAMAILASVLTLVWVALTGFGLLRMSGPPSAS